MLYRIVITIVIVIYMKKKEEIRTNCPYTAQRSRKTVEKRQKENRLNCDRHTEIVFLKAGGLFKNEIFV